MDDAARPLVFDLGMNNGDDAAHYLRCGCDVVAVEANPDLCAAARRRFAAEIASGRLSLVEAALAERPGEATFFLSVENDHWSSLDPGWAGRDGGAMRAVTVQAVTLGALMAGRPAPFAMKIDVEGADHVALAQLRDAAARPRFVSVEDCRFGPEYLETLRACGYDAFKLVDQSGVPEMLDPTTGRPFPAGASGPLGPATPGSWLGYDAALNRYFTTIRDPEGRRLAPRTRWWDIHAALDGGRWAPGDRRATWG